MIDQSPLDQRQIDWLLTVATRLLDVLDYVHSRDLLHRDLKPANVHLANAGDDVFALPPEIKLLDFGLARVRQTTIDERRFPSGTPLYMAPEQLAGRVDIDARADLYSVGALLYHTITGRPPFTKLGQALTQSPPAPPITTLCPACPATLADAIHETMALDRRHRPASAADLRARLSTNRSRPAHHTAEHLLAPSFVGRQNELDTLLRHAEEAATGQGRCVQVVGSAGVGKTWLLEQSTLKSEAYARFEFLTVRGAFSTSGGLLSGLRNVVEPLLDEATAQPGFNLPSDWVAHFRERFALQASDTPDADETERALPEARLAREQLLHLTWEVLRHAARRRPVLILLDDLHNADDLQLDIAARWRRASTELPVLLVMAHRPRHSVDADVFDSWCRTLHPDQTITLGPLRDGEVRELAASMLQPSAPVSEALHRHLIAASDGTPWSVTHALRTYWDHGGLRLDKEWCVDETAVRTESWPHRVVSLSPLDQRVVAAAIILGTPFDEDLLVAVVDSAGDRAALTESIADLTRRGFFDATPGGLATAPNLDELVLERCTDAETRATLHRNAADALQAADTTGEAYPFRIAAHLAAAGDASGAVKHYTAAARAAVSIHAQWRAREAYRLAFHHADETERPQLAEEYGEFLTRIGASAEALTWLRRASGFDVGDEPDGGSGSWINSVSLQLADKIGFAHHLQGAYAQALNAFERCLAEARSEKEKALAHFRLGSIFFDQGDGTHAQEHLRQSIERLENLSDNELLTRARWQLGLVEKLRGRLDEATRCFEQAVESAGTLRQRNRRRHGAQQRRQRAPRARQ